MAFAGIGRMTGGDDSENGVGGPASAFGKTSNSYKNPLAKKPMFAGNPGAGKLSKSGASTKSESLARLRGKGAIQ